MRNRQAINWDTLTGLLLQPMSLLLTVTAMILAAFRQDWIEVAAWVFVLVYSLGFWKFYWIYRHSEAAYSERMRAWWEDRKDSVR